MKNEISSGIVVFRRNSHEREYLLLEKKDGYLDFPKGHVESGESEEEAAKRETQEECGLEVVPMDGFRSEMAYEFGNTKDPIHKKVVMFAGEVPADASPRISFEHVGLRWLSFVDAMDQLRYDNQKELLEEVEKFNNGSSA